MQLVVIYLTSTTHFCSVSCTRATHVRSAQRERERERERERNSETEREALLFLCAEKHERITGRILLAVNQLLGVLCVKPDDIALNKSIPHCVKANSIYREREGVREREGPRTRERVRGGERETEGEREIEIDR